MQYLEFGIQDRLKKTSAQDGHPSLFAFSFNNPDGQ